MWLGVVLLLLVQSAPVREQVQQGYALAQRGDLTGAEAVLRRVLKAEPNNAFALGVLGTVLSQQSKFEEAERVLERAVEIDPNDLGARYSLAVNQIRLQRPAAAKANLEQLLARRPDSPQVKKLLADAVEQEKYETANGLFRAGQYAQSQGLLEQMTAAGARNPAVFHLLSACHQRQNHREDALASIRRAIEMAPADAALYVTAARYLLEDRNILAADGTVRKALELDPSHPQVLKVKGMLDVERGDVKGALATFERAAALDPSDPEMVFWLGTAQRMMFRYQEATATLKQGVARFPQYARMHEAWGRLLVDPGMHPDAAATARAASAFEKALALDPSLAQSHYELARLLLDDGRTAEAIRHLETATKLDPGDSAVLLALAGAYRLEGRGPDQARALSAYRQLEEQQLRLK